MVFERVYAAEYREPPTMMEFNVIADEVAALKRSAAGVPVHYLGIVRASAPVPTSADRVVMALFGKKIGALGAAAHLVLEGDGFRNSVQRSVITAVHILKGQQVTCYRTVQDACRRIAALTGTDFREMSVVVNAAFDD